MSERIVRVRGAGPLLAVVLLGLLAARAGAAGGPIDFPTSAEPRVPVARALASIGFLTSQGTFQPFERVREGDTLYSRDLLLVLPGFRSEVQSNSKAVRLTLWGNLPGLSDSPSLESAVVLHDSRAFDLDVTLLRGRIMLTNTKKKGPARIWLRTDVRGVALTLAEPGDQVALEINGRWAPGVPFSLTEDREPVRVWQINVLKGHLDITAGKNEWAMSAPTKKAPGRAYFHGDSVTGPDQEGPQPRKSLPEWADPEAPKPATAKMVESVVAAYRAQAKVGDIDEVPSALLAAADKDKNKKRAAMLRRLVVYALAAVDDVDKVLELLDTSKHDEVRKTAVIALRHWIGARPGRDRKLYNLLVDEMRYSKAEANTLMQLLHSPFAADQPETYETLIAYLRHRRQSVRELAHWHLIRLSPVEPKIVFDASAPAPVRDKAAQAWKKLIPSGELPEVKEDKKKDDTKKKPRKK
jgi:hypothetical protein